MPLDPYYDGDHTAAFPVGPPVPWQDDFTRSRLYSIKMRQLACYWRQSLIGMRGPIGGFLVDESRPRNMGASILEWEQTFADLPAPIAYPEPFVWPMQLLVTTSSSQDLAELPLGTTVKAQYTYFNTTQPWIDIPAVRACRWTKVGNTFFVVGTPYASGDTFLQAEDRKVTQWKGNIHQAKDLLIDVPVLTAH